MNEWRDDRIMTNDLVQYALDNGWVPRPPLPELPETFVSFDVWQYGTKKITFFTDDAIRIQIPFWEILFSHEFAKVIYGEHTEIFRDRDGYGSDPNYIIELQQQVTAHNPIEYAWKHSKLEGQREFDNA